MRTITTNPEDAQYDLDRACPGDTIIFANGFYYAPLTLRHCHGTEDDPVVLRGSRNAVFTMEMPAEDFREEGNRMARQVQREGTLGDGYPGLWPWLMEGRLRLESCSHVRVEGFKFVRSWPTHLAIRDSQHVRVGDCEFEDATFAIAASGTSTRFIDIHRCTWLQDPQPGRIWQQIPWQQIHGAPPDDPPVNVAQDWRLFDGDFFRGEEIAGDVTISHCQIGQAFNAIHLFNDHNDPDLCTNVNVHHCTFFEIRDNVIETEKSARNWWFHHNVICNCHKWFSFELYRNPYIYVFANCCWHNSFQGPREGDDNRGGGVFKLNGKARPPYGPAYVFHNSIVTRSDYIRRGIFAGLKHWNNAILGVSEAGSGHDEPPDFFGDISAGPDRLKKRFTSEWDRFGIEMRGDGIKYPGWPEKLRDEAGYPISEDEVAADPDFVDPHARDHDGACLKLGRNSECRGAALPLYVRLPDGGRWEHCSGSDVGAWQGDNLFEGPDYTTG